MSPLTGPVIIVEDDDAVRQSLKFALEIEGLHVSAYRSGQHLLAEKHLPSSGCLVIDYFMPSLDGMELISCLRRRHVELPAILITARATSDICERALRAGFRQVLEKPLEDGSLVECIRCALAACTVGDAKDEAPET